jgi:hypothetical protein
LSHLSLPTRNLRDSKADPEILRPDDWRARTAVSIAGHAFQRERLAGASPLGYLARSPLYNAAL